jgi:hypothetical protein
MLNTDTSSIKCAYLLGKKEWKMSACSILVIPHLKWEEVLIFTFKPSWGLIFNTSVFFCN